jgi:hypothetical protein
VGESVGVDVLLGSEVGVHDGLGVVVVGSDDGVVDVGGGVVPCWGEVADGLAVGALVVPEPLFEVGAGVVGTGAVGTGDGADVMPPGMTVGVWPTVSSARPGGAPTLAGGRLVPTFGKSTGRPGTSGAAVWFA